MILRSIKSKLIFWFSLSMSIILILTGILYYNREKKSLIEELRKDQFLNIEKISYDIERNIKVSEVTATTIAYTSEALNYNDKSYKETKSTLITSLSNILKNNDNLETAYTFFRPDMRIENELPYVCILRDKDKNAISFDVNNINDFKYWEQNWYKIAANSDKMQWTEPYLEEATKRKLVSGVQKIKNTKGEFIGVSGIDLHLDKIEEIMTNIPLEEKSFSFLLSAKGQYIYHPDKSYILSKNIYDKNDDLFDISSDIGKKESSFKEIKYKDEAYYVFYRTIESNNWVIGIAYPKSIIQNHLNNVLIAVLVLLIIGISLTVVLSTIISKKVLKSINLGIRASRLLAEGDLTNSIQIKSEDEIGILVNEINSSSRSIRNVISSIDLDINNLENISSELSDVSGQVSIVSNSIVNQVKDVQRDLELQSKNINDIYRNYEDMDKFLIQTYYNSKENLDKAIKSVEVVQGTKLIIQTSIEQLDKVIGLVKFSINAMSNLEERTKQIEDTIGSIKSIAKQTNLLALNASIEAAHTGNSGQGFVVIADEIRKLAVQSANTLSKIENLVGEIKKESNETVKSMDLDVKETIDQLTLIKNTQSNLDDIMLNLEEFMNYYDQLVSMIKEQVDFSENVREYFKEISQLSEGVNKATLKISDSTEDQIKIVKRLTENSQKLSISSESLKQLISKFKI